MVTTITVPQQERTPLADLLGQPCPVPGCGMPFELEDLFVLASTDGPLEHVKVRCASGHWFMGLVESVLSPSP